MFKQALVEMEGEKILESDSIPMSRPRIRLLLNQLNAQEEGDRPVQAKNAKDVLLTGMPGKAEREMFGKMVIQEREKNAKYKKNQDMKDLFAHRMEVKKAENIERQQRNEYRDQLKKTGGYYSASDSDADGALQAILDPFTSQDKGGNKKRKRRNTIEQKEFFEKQLNILGSSRGSSMEEEQDGSYGSHSPARQRHERKKAK